ncbi:hypothetical protein ACLOJK_015240 [Asimina triloba]
MRIASSLLRRMKNVRVACVFEILMGEMGEMGDGCDGMTDGLRPWMRRRGASLGGKRRRDTHSSDRLSLTLAWSPSRDIVSLRPESSPSQTTVTSFSDDGAVSLSSDLPLSLRSGTLSLPLSLSLCLSLPTRSVSLSHSPPYPTTFSSLSGDGVVRSSDVAPSLRSASRSPSLPLSLFPSRPVPSLSLSLANSISITRSLEPSLSLPNSTSVTPLLGHSLPLPPLPAFSLPPPVSLPLSQPFPFSIRTHLALYNTLCDLFKILFIC